MPIITTKFQEIPFSSFTEEAPFEIRKFKIFIAQFVSTTSETTEQNFMKPGSYYGHNM
jgi:hypothetical protein